MVAFAPLRVDRIEPGFVLQMANFEQAEAARRRILETMRYKPFNRLPTKTGMARGVLDRPFSAAAKDGGRRFACPPCGC